MTLIVVSSLLLLVLLCGVATYNRLVALRNHIRDAWANIDTELKRRYDLIPNLLNTVRGYAEHERTLLEDVARLRNQCAANHGSTEAQAADERLLVGALQKLLAVAEAYPQIKADQHFLELQRELVNTEDRIQAARRFFNGNVRDYRNARETFPSSLVAGLFRFGPMEFFDVEPAVRQAPQVAPR